MVITNQLKFCTTATVIESSFRYWIRDPVFPPSSPRLSFDHFTALKSLVAAEPGGSGLGLAIARQLADSNKWDVELLSSSSGGTKTVITIPRT